MFKLKKLLLCIHLITVLTTTAETTKTEKDINRRKRSYPSEYKENLGEGYKRSRPSEYKENLGEDYKRSRPMSEEELRDKIEEINELIDESMIKLREYNKKLRELSNTQNMKQNWSEEKFSTQPYKQAVRNDLKKLGSRALGAFNLKYSRPKEKKRYYD